MFPSSSHKSQCCNAATRTQNRQPPRLRPKSTKRQAKTETDFGKVEQFYEQVGQYAKTKGITVNIVSITGDECNLESLSKLAELTGGDVGEII